MSGLEDTPLKNCIQGRQHLQIILTLDGAPQQFLASALLVQIGSEKSKSENATKRSRRKFQKDDFPTPIESLCMLHQPNRCSQHSAWDYMASEHLWFRSCNLQEATTSTLAYGDILWSKTTSLLSPLIFHVSGRAAINVSWVSSQLYSSEVYLIWSISEGHKLVLSKDMLSAFIQKRNCNRF